MPRYKYKTLNDPSAEIRLLRLEPSDDPACLRGILSHHRLQSSLAFVALSYEWGESEPTLDLQLNGMVVQIRYNLWTFLEIIVAKIKARKIDPATLFWVDAICICQADTFEKNAQVALMGSIYSSAAIVFAWLGPASFLRPDRVFEFLLSESRRQKSNHDNAHPEKELERSRNFEDVLILSQCRYWTRRWILQELLLPKNVIIFWGAAELGFDHLLDFIDGFQALVPTEKFRPFSNSVLTRMARLSRNAKSRDRSLIELLEAFSDLECDTSTDRVYALRSLAQECDSIIIDYDISMHTLIGRLVLIAGWDSMHKTAERLEKALGAKGPGLVSDRMLAWDLDEPSAWKLDEPFHGLHMPLPMMINRGLRFVSRIQQIVPVDIDITPSEILDWYRGSDGIRVPFRSESQLRHAEGINPFTLIRSMLELESQCMSTPDFATIDFKVQAFSPILDTAVGEDLTSFALRAANGLNMLPANQWIRYRNERGGWVMICENGVVGVACEAASIGDLLYQTQFGELVVVRETNPASSKLVGNAYTCPTANPQAILEHLTSPKVVLDLLQQAAPAECRPEPSTEYQNSTGIDLWEVVLLTRRSLFLRRQFFVWGVLELLRLQKNRYYTGPSRTAPRDQSYWARWSGAEFGPLIVPANQLEERVFFDSPSQPPVADMVPMFVGSGVEDMANDDLTLSEDAPVGDHIETFSVAESASQTEQTEELRATQSANSNEVRGVAPQRLLGSQQTPSEPAQSHGLVERWLRKLKVDRKDNKVLSGFKISDQEQPRSHSERQIETV